MTKRRVLTIVVAACLLGAVGAGTGAAARHRWIMRFAFVPQRVFQGRPASVSAFVRSTKERCSLAVRYSDGSLASSFPKLRPKLGRVAWTWKVDMAAPAGAARLSVSCGRAGRLSRNLVVVGGTVVPAKLQIVAQGFSQRPQRVGGSSTLSFGIKLNNPSDTLDAKDVTVQVNALDADDVVLDTTTSRVTEIAAASIFDVGGSMYLPTQTPVSRLEIVVQAGSHVPHELHEPAVQNVRLVPNSTDPDWLDGVEGEVVNDDPALTLTTAQLSIVLLDSAGQVVGGGTGYATAKLPPGTRSFFKATSGFSAIPTANASTAEVSVEPMYAQPGS